MEWIRNIFFHFIYNYELELCERTNAEFALCTTFVKNNVCFINKEISYTIYKKYFIVGQNNLFYF